MAAATSVQTGSLVQQGASGVGQRHLLAVALEEPCADFHLQVTHLSAQGGLRQVQAFGRAAEVQLLRDGNEVAQVTQFHPSTLP